MLISIAGNIGAGKSSVIALLHEQYGWKPLYEPLMENPYLQDFYADMGSYAYRSQVYFLSKQCSAMEQIPEGKDIAVQDRTIYEDAEIFGALLFEMGHIDERDYATYRTLYNGITNVMTPPSAVIYLRADTDALIDNIRRRGRPFEQHIGRSYIEQLNDRYDQWASAFDLCPLHTIETGTFEFLSDNQVREEMVYNIRRLVH